MEKIDNYIQNQSLAVDIGAKIEIEVNGEPQIWEIVDFGKSDIPNGRISSSAPLVQCILGAKKGDSIKGKIMDKEIKILVKNISFLSRNI